MAEDEVEHVGKDGAALAMVGGHHSNLAPIPRSAFRLAS